MDLVRNPISRGAEVDPVASTGGLQVFVIIRIPVIGLQDVVVYVLRPKLHLDPLHSQGFEFQHGHGPGRILKESVIHADGNLLASGQLTLDKVSLQNLMGEILRHLFPLPSSADSLSPLYILQRRREKGGELCIFRYLTLYFAHFPMA
jgi:hypothetical protein